MPVWQNAFQIALEIHRLTSAFPKSEDYGLTSQMRRAAVSTFSNIAEGYGRDGLKDKRKFYLMGRASMMELQAQITYAVKVGYLISEDRKILEDQINPWLFSMNKLIKSFSHVKP